MQRVQGHRTRSGGAGIQTQAVSLHTSKRKALGELSRLPMLSYKGNHLSFSDYDSLRIYRGPVICGGRSYTLNLHYLISSSQ